MFATDTQRRIDTAREIFVGKLPDPKSRKLKRLRFTVAHELAHYFLHPS